MKNQNLFSLKNKSEKLKCHLLQFLFGPLRVKRLVYIKDRFSHPKQSIKARLVLNFFNNFGKVKAIL